jgi:uncharacterized membrane protein YvbJ
MICPNCRAQNPDAAAFCAQCRLPILPPVPVVAAPVAPRTATGAPVNPYLCRVCGTNLEARQTCAYCGTPIGTIVNPNDATCSTYLYYGYPYPAPAQAASPTPRAPLSRRVALGWIVAILGFIGLLWLALLVSRTS